MTVWQGDFGKGVSTGSGVWSEFGANPCLLYGPIPSSGLSSGGIINPQFRLGMVIGGDSAAEFIFCKLVLGSTTDILPGLVFQIDEYFTATLLTTGTGAQQAEMGVGQVFAPATAAGTYYIWLQRAGHASVQAAGSSLTKAQAESTTTAGVVKFLNTHTALTLSTDGLTSFVASQGVTFTGNTTSGSPYITNVVSAMTGGGITDLVLGQTITGTNLPANACIAAIDKVGGLWRVTIGTSTTGNQSVLQNATGTASSTTFTVTSHVSANVYWPQLKTQN